jgi:mannose-6-phosphate isomerase-like protein (cupin superfamily)
MEIDRRSVLAGGAALAAGLFNPSLLAAQQGSAMPGARIRRVVTARNAQGKSYIAIDDEVNVANIWTTKPEQPIGAVPGGELVQVSKATGEGRFFFATIQPSRDPKPNLDNRIGFHLTPGIAYCLILTGEIVLLTDTQEVRVRAGDLVIERNTLHSWRNEGTAPVTMAITVVNAV